METMVPETDVLYKFLNEHDTIPSDSLIRVLYDQTDSFGPGFMYRPQRWYKSEEVLPAWIGQTLYDLHRFSFGKSVPYNRNYEIIAPMYHIK